MNSTRLQFDFKKQFAQKKIMASGDVEFASGNWILSWMGSSGAGKTSTARWMAGLLDEDEGFLKFNGKTWCENGKRVPTQERRVGFLPQGDYLFPHLDVAANIGYSLRRDENRGKKVLELMDLTGVTPFAKRSPRSLSGGEKRRVALAQVLAMDPCFLILDEPFSGLDEETRGRLMSDLKRWIEQFEIPTLLITHHAVEAQTLTDRIYRFSDGYLKI